MFYKPRPEEQRRVRARLEPLSAEETVLRNRIRDSWPADILLEDGWEAEEVSGKVLRRILQEHDRPHRDVRNESWHVNGVLGRGRQYTFSATFSLTAVNSGVNPPDEFSDLKNLSDVQWTITDNTGEKPRYYRFSCLDHRAPLLMSALLAKGELGNVEPHLMQATIEQLNRDALIRPDQMMDGPASARFSKLDLRFGQSFLKSLQPDQRVEGMDVLATAKYHLHLEGCTNEDATGDMEKEAKAVLDVVFAPRAVPMLDGDHGILGLGDWKSDMFVYSFPNMKIVECALRVTRVSDGLQLARDLEIRHGTIWMDHRFGGVVPRSTAEADFLRTQRIDVKKPRQDVRVDRAMLRIFHRSEVVALAITAVTPIVEVVKDGDTYAHLEECKERRHLYVAVQNAKTRSGYGHWSTPETRKDAETGDNAIEVEVDLSDQYRSADTSVLFPCAYTITTPLYDGAVAKLVVKLDFPQQELVSTLLQPSAWVGFVSVEGTVTEPAAAAAVAGVDAQAATKTETKVMGEGFLQSYGWGLLQRRSALLDAFRSAGSSLMEGADVGRALRSAPASQPWVALAEGPALAAITRMADVARLMKVHLTDAHKVVLSAMFGVYGYIFHHPTGERAAVEGALAWCQSKWLTYFARDTLDCATLTVRAFMLRDLGYVVHTKCAAWVPKEAAALDILSMELTSTAGGADEKEWEEVTEPLPTVKDLDEAPSALELSQLKALMDGKWVYASATGSLSAVLVEQHVPVLWRNLMGKAKPIFEHTVDREQHKVSYTMTTIIEEVDREFHLNGKEWTWRCPARGELRSRACVLNGGKQLYVQALVGQGIERTWYTFHHQGGTLKMTTAYYRAVLDTVPAAWCVQEFAQEKAAPVKARK